MNECVQEDSNTKNNRPLIVFTLVTTGFLLFNMLILPFHVEQVFQEREISLNIELVFLIGFLLIPLFNVVSIIVLSNRISHSEGIVKSRLKMTLFLGMLCLILLLGEKTMADEIAREYRLGWDTLGEWIILYIMLSLQLLYNIIFFIQIRLFPVKIYH